MLAKVGRDRHDPVRVLLPAPGRAVRRQHARERRRARLLHGQRRRCSGRCRSRSLLLAMYYGAIGVAIVVAHRPPHRRRAPRSSASLLVTSIVSGIILDGEQPATATGSSRLLNLLAIPLHLRDLVFLGHIDPDVAARRRRDGGLPRRHRLRRRARRPRSRPAVATGGWTRQRRRHPQSPMIPRSRPTRPSRSRDVSVWFGPKVALSELSCSFGPGVTGLLGPNGAGKTTLMRAITGLIGSTRARSRIEGCDPRRDSARSSAASRWCPRTKPCRPGSRPASSCATSPTCTASPTATRPTARCDTVGLLDVADRRVDGFSKGMRQRTKVAAALVSDPRCSCSTSRLNGADPVQRAAPHRPVPARSGPRAAP